MPSKKSKAARRTRRQAKDTARTLPAMMKSVLLALPVTLAIGLLLIFITTAVLLSTTDPDRYRSVAGLILLYATAFLGGVLATAFYSKHSPVLCGLCEGLLLCLITAIPALFVHTGESNGALVLLMRCALLPFSLLGAMLCARKPKKSKMKRH